MKSVVTYVYSFEQYCQLSNPKILGFLFAINIYLEVSSYYFPQISYCIQIIQIYITNINSLSLHYTISDSV